ncbi:hypothetical protein [Hydrocoleum sp. CS-953]|nr:hypothetical protein [Hydrocoleum sp. CS-953]
MTYCQVCGNWNGVEGINPKLLEKAKGKSLPGKMRNIIQPIIETV